MAVLQTAVLTTSPPRLVHGFYHSNEARTNTYDSILEKSAICHERLLTVLIY